MEEHEKVGVIIARFQPIHYGHLELIGKACQENDKVIVFIGSIDKLNKRNPIPWTIRKEMVMDAMKEQEQIRVENNKEPLFNKVTLVELPDLTDESQNNHEWGFYLYANVMEHSHNPYFTIYYSDGFEIITSWFPGWLLRKHISLSLLARDGCQNGISATAVRNAIIYQDDELLQAMVPTCVYNKRDIIRSFIKVFN